MRGRVRVRGGVRVRVRVGGGGGVWGWGGEVGWEHFEHFLDFLCEASGAAGPMVQGPLGPHLILVGPCSLCFKLFVEYVCCIVLPIVLPISCLVYYLRTPSHQAPHPDLPPQWLRDKGLGLWVGGGFGLEKCGVGESGLTHCWRLQVYNRDVIRKHCVVIRRAQGNTPK